MDTIEFVLGEIERAEAREKIKARLVDQDQDKEVRQAARVLGYFTKGN